MYECFMNDGKKLLGGTVHSHKLGYNLYSSIVTHIHSASGTARPTRETTGGWG